jgi:hypothetical protein
MSKPVEPRATTDVYPNPTLSSVRYAADGPTGWYLYEDAPNIPSIAFFGTTSVPTGLGGETVIDIAEVLSNDRLVYSVAAGVVTLNEAGIYLVCLNTAYGLGATGTIRWSRVVGSTALDMLRASAPPSAGVGPGAGSANVFSLPEGELIDVRARHDQGANINVSARLSISRLAPV